MRLKLVISDFHLSRGKWLPDGRRNPLEDFHEDQRFKEMLEHYSTGQYAAWDVELVVNGDFFDPLAVIPMREKADLEFPIEVEEGAAIEKFRAIMDGHPVTMHALRSFLGRGKKIVFRWGNHDAGILWPAVQELVRERLTPPEAAQVVFQQERYIFDRICIDHGHQYEMINNFDESKMFIERETSKGKTRIQNLPFGSFFVLSFLNRIKLNRSYINQVQPLRTYLWLGLYLDPLFVIGNGFRVAWFFLKMRFITHPMRFARIRKTLGILSEMIRRPSLEEVAEKLLTGLGSEDLAFDTLVLGHNHQATIRAFPNGKQYINTGTWTPITSLDMSTLGHRILRTYALIEYVDGKARASLKIWNGNPQITEDFA